MKRDQAHMTGCIVGGAIGDAFGAPVKFMKYDKIAEHYERNGITVLADLVNKQRMEITDDTQLTLFTAEGLIRSFVRSKQKGIERSSKDTTMVVYKSYIRWLYTQGLKMPNWQIESYDGWLIKVKELYGYRDPGITCITALGKGVMGKIDKPINKSNRCGSVIRVAPVGLIEDKEHVFEVGCQTGAITHGDPAAYLAAGALATIIFYIIEGYELEEAIGFAIDELNKHAGGESCVHLLKKALDKAKEPPSTENLHTLGDGFSAQEAVAMGVYTALCYKEDFEAAILFAIKQSGNSNSVAVITGNLLGAYLGIEAINQDFIKKLELAGVIIEVGEDLYKKYEETKEWSKKYPGW